MAHQHEDASLLRIDVRGADDSTWIKLREKLLDAINGLLNSVVDDEKGTTLREASKELKKLSFDHLKATLERRGIENHEAEARIAETYARQEKELAEARKTNAEADKITFENNIRKLTFILKTQQAMMVESKSETALVVGKEVALMLKVLNEFAGLPE